MNDLLTNLDDLRTLGYHYEEEVLLGEFLQAGLVAVHDFAKVVLDVLVSQDDFVAEEEVRHDVEILEGVDCCDVKLWKYEDRHDVQGHAVMDHYDVEQFEVLDQSDENFVVTKGHHDVMLLEEDRLDVEVLVVHPRGEVVFVVDLHEEVVSEKNLDDVVLTVASHPSYDSLVDHDWHE